MPKQWTIRELAEEFDVSKQAIRKQLSVDFRANYVQTITSNGVQTLIVNNDGYLLLNKHFRGSNNSVTKGGTVTGNGTNPNDSLFDTLKQQLITKDKQLTAKDEQLKSMQKLLDQSQQLQLVAENKIKEFKAIASEETTNNRTQKQHKWWQFW